MGPSTEAGPSFTKPVTVVTVPELVSIYSTSEETPTKVLTFVSSFVLPFTHPTVTTGSERHFILKDICHLLKGPVTVNVTTI